VAAWCGGPGGFLFLRFFCPALVQPLQHGLGNVIAGLEDPAVRRVLVLVTKVLQNLANKVQFGSKELFMAPFNGFLEDNAPAVADYLDGFAVRPPTALPLMG